MVFRIYVEKKHGFDVKAQQLTNELRTILGIDGLQNLRMISTEHAALSSRSFLLIKSSVSLSEELWKSDRKEVSLSICHLQLRTSFMNCMKNLSLQDSI